MTGSVYAVERPDGMVKIGVSNNPRRRMRTIETQGGFKAKAKFFADSTDNGYEIEKLVHEHFKPYRKVGEWFSVDFRIAIHVIDTITKKYGNHDYDQEVDKSLPNYAKQMWREFEDARLQQSLGDAMEDIRKDDPKAYEWLVRNEITAKYVKGSNDIWLYFYDENGEFVEIPSRLFIAIAKRESEAS